MLKIYAYKNCGTCRKAIKFLNENKIAYTELPIRETPPTKEELATMLDSYGGHIKKLFNTSGQDYRALDIKSTISTMSKDTAFELLSTNGNLVKRPFVLFNNQGLVGFKEEEWEQFK